MSSLFVDRRDAHLEFDAGALVFRDNGKEGERIGTVPLAPLKRIFLRGNLTLQASLLGKLGELGIGVVVLTGRLGKPSLMLGHPHNDARRRVAQTRLSLDAGFCLSFARQIIHAKLAAQQAWLGARVAGLRFDGAAASAGRPLLFAAGDAAKPDC